MTIMRFFQYLLSKAIGYLAGFNPLLLSIFTAILGLGLVLIISLFDTATNPVATMTISLTEKFFLVCVISPIVETLLFQKFIIGIANKYLRNDLAALALSSTAFALVHNYSTLYMIKMFVAGLLFGLLYLVCRRRLPLLYVVTAHATYNIIVFILSFILSSQTI